MAGDRVLKEITPKTLDFSQWYSDIVRKADLMDYAPIKGFMVIKPYGYRIWELIQGYLDARFRATGHQNAYFPLLIPESLFLREAEHVAGFTPEVAWVTHGGSEPLAERLAIRPTSETIIGEMYSRWIQSYRDLPVLINQWCSVVRWEKATRPFLRTSEFLWQEGHTVHRTEEEAVAETLRMLEIYRQTIEGELAIPVVAGRKSAQERFAGAVDTYTLEALMGDGKALQTATSHFLGQNFARAFNIQFLDEDGQLKYGWTTSWGVSTRLIGALIMVHGDDRGLRLPPAVAPVQVVIVPIGPGAERERVVRAAWDLKERLPSWRVHVDDRPEFTPGWKYNDWEMRGVPLRIEVGPRDLAAQQAVLVRRDTGVKTTVPLTELPTAVDQLLTDVQVTLFRQAQAWREAWSRSVERLEEISESGQADEGLKGFVWADWCGDSTCETAVRERTGATLRCLPDEPPATGRCLVCGRPGSFRAVFARSY
jgi:prolyl-tRNA synthetase